MCVCMYVCAKRNGSASLNDVVSSIRGRKIPEEPHNEPSSSSSSLSVYLFNNKTVQIQ